MSEDINYYKVVTKELKKIDKDLRLLSVYKDEKSQLRVELYHKKCKRVFSETKKSLMSGHGCPFCNKKIVSKGEKNIEDFFIDKHIKYETQYKIAKCKNIHVLPFDFYLPKQKILIEFDGIQHYEPRFSHNGKPDVKEYNACIQRDAIKNKYTSDNEIPLLRIPFWKFSEIDTILNELVTFIDQPFNYDEFCQWKDSLHLGSYKSYKENLQ